MVSVGLIVSWDQGGLPKSVFLQAGTQPSQGHPEPPSGMEADAEVQILLNRGLKLVPIIQVDSLSVSVRICSTSLEISKLISSHSLLCIEWKAPNADCKIAPKLDIYHNKGGERVHIRWSVTFILFPVNHLTAAGRNSSACQEIMPQKYDASQNLSAHPCVTFLFVETRIVAE